MIKFKEAVFRDEEDIYNHTLTFKQKGSGKFHTILSKDTVMKQSCQWVRSGLGRFNSMISDGMIELNNGNMVPMHMVAVIYPAQSEVAGKLIATSKRKECFLFGFRLWFSQYEYEYKVEMIDE